MEIVRLSDANLRELVARAVGVLRAGGVVLYPTDTLYGLGADATSDEAVAKIYDIKGREEGKPIHAIVADLDMAARYAEVSDDVRLLVERLPQGQVTFVLKKSAQGRSASGGKNSRINSGILRNINTFGFRIPANELCIQIAQEFGKLFTATSANRSGERSERSVEKIFDQLNSYSSVLPARRSLGAGGQKTAIEIDLVVDAGELPERAPSTVVDLSGAEPVILREGAIPASDVWNALRDEP